MSVPIRTDNGLFSGWEKPASPETAVYRIYDVSDQLLYVGITNDTTARWYNHATYKPWWKTDAHRYDVRWYPTRSVALDEERKAIQTERPKHNVVEMAHPLVDVTPRAPGAYSTGEIARRFRISRDTIRALIEQGDFPKRLTDLPSPYRKGKRYAVAEVEHYFTRRRPPQE